MHDVIVIGGGLSGLSAAKLLEEQYGLDVVVLEAQERVGGRTHTTEDPAYGYVDVGGAYVGPTQRRVYRLAKDLSVETYCVNQKERTLMNMKGTFLKYHGVIPPILNPIKALDLNNAQLLLDKLAKQVPVDAPWKAKKAKEWDAMTYKQFIDQTCWTEFAAESMRLVCYAVLCVYPHEVSLLFVLWYIASGQGIMRLVTITNGAQERKFVGGSMQLSTKMADRLGSSRVKLNHPVVRVEQTSSEATVTCANGETFQGRYVISAAPLALLNRITFDPPLHSMKIQLIQKVPMGSIIKTMMFYKTAFWKQKGLCGEMITDQGPVLYCMDDTKPDGSHPAIMGFILANHAREMVDLTPEQRKQAVAEHYAKVFRNKDFLDPINYVEKNWMADEYAGGCYTMVMPPGALTAYGHVLREPHGLVHFAGTETATMWSGYMDGAIQAGERAAREILCNMKKIDVGDIEQEEPLLPEFPEPPVQQFVLERVLPSVTGVVRFSAAVTVAALSWIIPKYLNIRFK